MTKIKADQDRPGAQGAEGVGARVRAGRAFRSGRQVQASELAVGEVVRWSSGRRRVVRSVSPEPGVGKVGLVFEDGSSVIAAADAKWKIISSPYDHLTDADIKAVFGWLCPGRGERLPDAAGA